MEYASIAVRKAVQLGADEAEAYASISRGVEASIKNNNLDTSTSFEEEGLGIRVVVDKRVGFAYTSALSIESIIGAVERAVKIARASEPDPRWPGLPEPGDQYPEVRNTFDPSIASFTIDKAVEKASELLRYAREDDRVNVVWGGVETLVEEKAVANTNGVYKSGRGTFASAFVETVANEAGEATPSCYSLEERRIGFPSIEPLAREAAEEALRSLGARRGEGGVKPVILTEKALFMLINFSLLQAVKGDNVARGRSPYVGKIGEQVASSSLDIIDDGTMKGGLGTWSFDDEGIPTARSIIIEEGILRGFLYDSYWAARSGAKPTGNSWRRSGYLSLPTITMSNLIISPGDATQDEIISESKGGVLVDGLQGAHSTNPETGEFSVVATPAWLISEEGLKPVRGLMLAGNVYELLHSIDMVGRNIRSISRFYAPWVRFSGMRVVSK